ncbi:MAG TPA: A24 family peptidase [Nitrolancea sp.]|nr:A24 family peptidase [Nitrolancea sp.]
MLLVALVLTGLLLGACVNLLIDRLPRRQALLGRPTCAVCGAARPIFSFIPVAGWLSTRGRCQTCGARARLRALIVELGLPLAGIALWYQSGGQAYALLQLVFVAYFAAIVAIDLEHRLVLNRMTAAGLLAAFAIAAAGLGPSLSGAVAGAVIGFLFLWIPSLLLPGMGMGDIKLAAVIGAMVGSSQVLTALTLGVIAGGVAAAVLLVSRRIERRGSIAYAPYLVVGVALVLFGVVR